MIRITAVSQIVGLPPSTLRYWGRVLGWRLSRVGGQRFYTEGDIAQIRRAIELQNEGYTLKGIRRQLAARPVPTPESKS